MCDDTGLEFVVGDNYRESFPEIMGVLPGEALQVAREPDTHEAIEVGKGNALYINISVRKPSESKPYFLMVLDRVDEQGVCVLHDAFKFYDDLCEGTGEKSPLELLSFPRDKALPHGEIERCLPPIFI